MNIRTLLPALALLLGVTAACTEEATTTPAAPADTPTAPAQVPAAPVTAAAKVVVTLFTVNEPCDATKAISRLSRRAVDEGFPDELKSGALVYRVINTDLPENEHFLDDYDIGGKALVISRRDGDAEAEWMSCDDVWLLFSAPDEFLPYVQQPIRDYLAKS